MSDNNKMTLDEARAAGFIIDYPAALAGEGMPLGDLWGEPTGERRAFDHFEPSPLTPLAGFLVREAQVHSVPCFLKGYDRTDALEDAAARKN